MTTLTIRVALYAPRVLAMLLYTIVHWLSVNDNILRKKKHLSFAGACLQMNTTFNHLKSTGEMKNWTNLHLEPKDYRIYNVNIHLYNQYGIFVSESQSFLLTKCPEVATWNLSESTATCKWLPSLHKPVSANISRTKSFAKILCR